MKFIVIGVGSLLALFMAIGVRVMTAGGQEPAVPALFVKGYALGEEHAGFTGRPMVLVFGDSRLANKENRT